MVQALRSIGAIFMGWLVFAASAVALFRLTGRSPHQPATLSFMFISTLYGMFFAGIAGFLTAWLARRWEIEHSLAVATIIAVGGAVSLLASPGLGAIWTQLTALLLMAPMAMVGGYIRMRQTGHLQQ
jgi:hypothetical protein